MDLSAINTQTKTEATGQTRSKSEQPAAGLAFAELLQTTGARPPKTSFFDQRKTTVANDAATRPSLKATAPKEHERAAPAERPTRDERAEAKDRRAEAKAEARALAKAEAKDSRREERAEATAESAEAETETVATEDAAAPAETAAVAEEAGSEEPAAEVVAGVPTAQPVVVPIAPPPILVQAAAATDEAVPVDGIEQPQIASPVPVTPEGEPAEPAQSADADGAIPIAGMTPVEGEQAPAPATAPSADTGAGSTQTAAAPLAQALAEQPSAQLTVTVATASDAKPQTASAPSAATPAAAQVTLTEQQVADNGDTDGETQTGQGETEAKTVTASTTPADDTAAFKAAENEPHPQHKDKDAAVAEHGAQQSRLPEPAAKVTPPGAAVALAAQAENKAVEQAPSTATTDSTGTAAVGQTNATTATGAAKMTGMASAPRAATPGTPMEQVSVQIAKAVNDGADSITVKLSPESLGRVEVKLEIHQGRVHAIVTADNKETMTLMQQDQRGLEKALQDAGLQTDSNSLSFNLRGEQQQQERQEFQENLRSRRAAARAATQSDEAEALPGQAARSRRVAAGGVDIKV